MTDNPAGIILNKAKAQGLVISRVPIKTREEFINFSDENFAGDYGMTLVELWNNYKRSQFIEVTFFSNIDLKLNYLISKVDKDDIPKQEEEKPKKEIKFLDGRISRRDEKEVLQNVTT